MWNLWGLAAPWEGRDVSLAWTLQAFSTCPGPELSKVSRQKWGRADIFKVKKPSLSQHQATVMGKSSNCLPRQVSFH